MPSANLTKQYVTSVIDKDVKHNGSLWHPAYWSWREIGPYYLGVITLCIAWVTQAGSFGWPVNGQQRWYWFGNFISVAYGFTVTPPYCLHSACSGSISFPLVLCLPSQLDGCRLLFHISVLQLQQLWPGNWSDKQAFWDGKLIYFLNGCLL